MHGVSAVRLDLTTKNTKRTKVRAALAITLMSFGMALMHGCATPQPAATRSIQLELPAMEYAQ